jgi:exopolysaccharide biosynthesis polyprenyl glycosylphosphotransferase
VLLPTAGSAAGGAAAVVAWPAAVLTSGGYTRVSGVRHPTRLRSLARAAATLSLAAWAAVALTPWGLGGAEPRSVAAPVLTVLLVAAVLSGLLRLLLTRAVTPAPAGVVVAGHAAGVGSLLAEARRDTGRWGPTFVPVGVCLMPAPSNDELELLADTCDVPVWHGSGQLLDCVRTQGAEAVIVAPGPEVGHVELRRWGAWLQDEGVDLLVHHGLRDVAPARLGHSTIGGARLLHLHPAPVSGPRRLLKDAVDRTLAALLLLGLAPLLVVLALLIRAETPGPAFFRQPRVGRGGRIFTVYKLRTMSQDADRSVGTLRDANESDRAGVLFKMKCDPRVTRLGRTLRKFSLDELPQLINVVRGEMSLIGPRPALPSEVVGYSDDLRRRLAVKPGLTGLWQVSGRSDLSWDETVRLDLQYVDNWSWSLDLTIAVRTVKAVLRHEGAY